MELAMDQLESQLVLNPPEEIVLNFLKSVYPKRVPTETPTALPRKHGYPLSWIQDSNVSLAIYDTAGCLVRHLDLEFQPAGAYLQRDRAIYWDGRTQSGEQVASGTYFYTLKTDDYTFTQKMIILK